MSTKTNGTSDEQPNAGQNELITVETPENTKPKLSWKGRLALLPEDEAKAIRAKAAEASRRSKAKKKGTSPEQAAVSRIEARLAKADAQLAELKALRTDLATELKAAKAALAAAQKAQAAEAKGAGDAAGA